MLNIDIDFKDAVEKYKIEYLNDIEQKLYLISLFLDNIKENNLYSLYIDKEITIFKEIKFIIKDMLESRDTINLSGKRYFLSQYKRIINFIDDKSEKIYVINYDYFRQKINDKKFKLVEYSGTNKTIDSKDSLSSELNEKELLDIYENQAITEIKKIETNTKKILEKFIMKSDCPHKISDLSINMNYYINNETIKNDIEFKEDLIHFEEKKIIVNFYYNEFANILYFFGPKGCGKTTRLLFSSLNIHNNCYLNNPRIYIDYKLMKEKSQLRKLIFKQEMFYMVQTEEKLKELFNLRTHKKINERNNFFEFFKLFLEDIINSNIFKETIFVIIDNYDEYDKEINNLNNNYINSIIKLSKENSKMIKLIISGNGLFMKEKQKLFLNRELSDKYAINKEMCLVCPAYNYENNEKINKNKIPSYIYSHPEFYFKFLCRKSNEKDTNINEFSDSLIKVEEDSNKDINFFGCYYSLIYENKELLYKEFNKYYDIS